MITYLKFTFIFLIELIRTNIYKSIFVAIAIISFNYAGIFPTTTDTYKIIHETKIEDTHIYMYKTISNDKVEYKNISSDKPIKITNGEIKLQSYNGINVLFWIIFVISFLIVFIATIIGDSDTGWEVNDSWKEAISSLIYCEEDGGQFYYFVSGRLISKRDTMISRSQSAMRELNIGGFRDIYRCPKYQTKSKKRDNILNKIGIK